MTAPEDNSIIMATAPAVVYDKKNPFPSTLKRRVLLNKEGSNKETLHLELCLAGSGLEYRPGDSLAIIPANSPQAVGQVLEAGGFDAGETVELKGGETKPLGEVFATDLNITGVTKNVLKKYNAFAQSGKLESLLDPDNKAALDDYLGGREVIDMIADFPVPGLAASDFCGTLRKQLPRLYSIASSLRAHPDEVHLTIASVRYHSHGRDREGVCSTYTADRVDEGGTMPVFLHYDKNFKLPEDGDTPIIMVGPGTGIAPFRAFVEERDATGAIGKSWLFFGDQHSATDYLYGDEWERCLADGRLSRIDLAFSRDQEHKVYVQHRMLEHAAEMYSWLSDGAVFYVCGDASRMAKDVHEALITIGEQEGGKSREEAEAWVNQLKADKQYLRDVY
jgi:sulfite reductase (NADPH) flavoprotein alpha-component